MSENTRCVTSVEHGLHLDNARQCHIETSRSACFPSVIGCRSHAPVARGKRPQPGLPSVVGGPKTHLQQVVAAVAISVAWVSD